MIVLRSKHDLDDTKVLTVAYGTRARADGSTAPTMYFRCTVCGGESSRYWLRAIDCGGLAEAFAHEHRNCTRNLWRHAFNAVFDQEIEQLVRLHEKGI